MRNRFFKLNKLQKVFNILYSIWKKTFKNMYQLSCFVGHTYLIYLKSKSKLGVNKNLICIIWKNCFLYRLAFIALCKTFSLNKDINQKSFCLISFPGVKFEMFKNGPSNDTELFRLRINMVFKEYTFLRIHSLLENTKKYSPLKFFRNLLSQCVKNLKI